MEKLMTLQEVAGVLQVHHRTVRRLVHTRKLQSMRLSPSTNSPMRFKREWVENYIHSRQARAS
jgi:excisionase family DNA binding protein